MNANPMTWENLSEVVLLDAGFLDEVYEQIRHGQVAEGMNALLPVLLDRRLRLDELAWGSCVRQCLEHPLRELLHQDPFTYRAFSKPRGYAGDAPLLDFIYGHEEGWPVPEGTSEVGQQVFAYTTHSPACEGVRARRGFIADLLDQIAEELPRPHVLSVAAGHLREASLSAAVRRRRLGRFIALDGDPLSLEEVQRCYGRHGVEVAHARIRQILVGQFDLGLFDLIYSTGLFDYLAEGASQRLASALFRSLRPRGRLLIANFLPGIPDRGYMESYMGWKLIYRTRREMIEILRDIPQEEIRDIRIFAEENQNILFVQVTRN